jgi:DHA1 family multidrug resistance protein-like MFS transporter
LTDLERQRGLNVILAGTFLMYFGFFVCIPLIAVRFVDGLGWSAASVGLILGARQITQFGLTMFGGALADRFGPKRLLLFGMFVRGLGFAAMGFANSFGLLLAATVLSALGGAMFESPRMAAIAALTDEKSRTRFLSLAATVGGVGMTLGPLVGSWLYRADFALVCVVAGACYIVGMLFTWPLLPDVRSGATQHLTEGLWLASHDRRFVVFVLILIGVWFGSTQLSISLPLQAVAVSGTQQTAGWVYTLNALMVVGLQYPLMRALERRLETMQIVVLGVSVVAVGFISIAFASQTWVFLVAVAVFALGQLIALPAQQAMGARLANPKALGSYFGVQAISQAVGGSLGSVAGGTLYGLGRQLGMPALPWLTFAAIAALTAFGLSRLVRDSR